MKKLNVAIVGATGAVGQELLKVIDEHQFPYASLKLLASKQDPWHKRFTIDGIMTDRERLTQTTKDHFLMGVISRQANAVNVHAFNIRTTCTCQSLDLTSQSKLFNDSHGWGLVSAL